MMAGQNAPAGLLSKATINLSKTESITCPLCRSALNQLRHQVAGWKIVECRRCQFVYVNPRLEKTELLNLYASNYFNNKEVGYFNYTESKPLRKKNFRKWVHDALPHVNTHKNVKALDVGCAAGYCLEVFKELGWQPYGIELDKQLVKSLRENGFSIFDIPLLNISTAEKFDLIALFDVLEHLTDLQENMGRLHSLLTDEGVVVLVTPDYGNWQRKIFGKNWFQFKPIEHINYFSRKTLHKLATENGFEIIKTANSGQFCDVPFLENRLRRYRLHFVLPLFYLVVKLLGLKNKHFYTDTASVYAVLRKKETSAEAATRP